MSTGVLEAHPYAQAWPLLAGEDLATLAEDIAAAGLRDDILLYGGMVLDGRNRLAACEQAGVEPHFVEFEGDDDAALAYVQSVNNARRHQSKGSLAASWALSMLAAGKRRDGRWAYGESRDSDISRDNRSILGVIADHAPDLLTAVRDDELSLNAAHEKACEARDAERDRLDREEREAAEEAEAKTFVEDTAPDLARLVGVGNGYPYQSYAEALAVWEKRNREEAERLAREKAAKEKAERERKASLTQHFSEQIGKALMTIGGYGERDDPAEVMAEFSPAYLSPPQLERYYTLPNLHNARRFVDALITWQEQR